MLIKNFKNICFLLYFLNIFINLLAIFNLRKIINIYGYNIIYNIEKG